MAEHDFFKELDLVTYSEKRPWGGFAELKPAAKVKELVVAAGEELSLQSHKKREELWLVMAGNPTIRVGDESHTYFPGARIFIPVGAKHQAIAPDTDVRIVELSFGEFDEDDIIRYSDKYNRV